MGQQVWVCSAVFFICFSGFSVLSHTECFGMLLSIVIFFSPMVFIMTPNIV